MYKEITECRICGNKNLVSVINLGEMALTGVFPRSKNELVDIVPLELVKCHGDTDGDVCNLLQLKHSFEPEKMYGNNYGYRSGLNQLMIDHLQYIVKLITNFVSLEEDDLIIDIGSNDGTLLKNYDGEYNLIGVDPTGEKFRKYYPYDIQLISDFFSKELIQKFYPTKKARVITSIAMFYDLESPLDFMRQVYDILDDDGIWVIEQSYMPMMLRQNAYDTICHEHLEYYGFYQIKWMADRMGFDIIHTEVNSVNGGSFLVVLAKKESQYLKYKSNLLLESVLDSEKRKGLLELKAYFKFQERIFEHRNKLIKVISNIKKEGKLVVGYGASTKGNVLLQLCNFTEEDIFCIVEINKDKFGCFTPGTKIPIVSEDGMEMVIGTPDYYLVLPWHFKSEILKNEIESLKDGVKFIFPLPEIEFIDIVNAAWYI